MTVIGFRASPKIIYFSIITTKVDGTHSITNDKLIIPISFALPDKLKYIRQAIIDVIKSNDIKMGSIKIVENNANSPSKERIMIEGVITELLASCGVEKYYAGPSSTILSKNNIENKRGTFKDFVSGTTKFKNLENWSDYNSHFRESIITAFGLFES